MAGALIVNARFRIPESAIELRFARASGPGGQNVNKVATKVELRIDLEAIEGATVEERTRLRDRLRHRLDTEGRLIVTSQATRHQARNVEDARFKAAELIRAALRPPKVRRPTRPTSASKERRLTAKRRRAEHLRERRIEEN